MYANLLNFSLHLFMLYLLFLTLSCEHLQKVRPVRCDLKTRMRWRKSLFGELETVFAGSGSRLLERWKVITSGETFNITIYEWKSVFRFAGKCAPLEAVKSHVLPSNRCFAAVNSTFITFCCLCLASNLHICAIWSHDYRSISAPPTRAGLVEIEKRPHFATATLKTTFCDGNKIKIN